MARNPLEVVFHDFVDLFERLSIPYAVMGGLAVRAHGIPRPTYDVDVTVLVDRSKLPEMFAAIRQAGYDVPQAYDTGWVDEVAGMPLVKAFTFAEGRSLAADIFLAESPFQLSLMERRVRERVNGFDAWLVSAEDLLLLKLLAGRQRDLADVSDILMLNLSCDEDYLRHWADVIGVRDKLEQVLRETK